jgi:hypothetical protein
MNLKNASRRDFRKVPTGEGSRLVHANKVD